MNKFGIRPTIDQEYIGASWMLAPEDAATWEKIAQEIKAFEFQYNIHRIMAPHVRRDDSNDRGWRFVNDFFKDSIEIAAKAELVSYKDLPRYYSVLDALYKVEDSHGILNNYIWMIARYGEKPDQEIMQFALHLSNDVSQYTAQSAISLRGKDNICSPPEVIITKVILI